MNAVQYVRCSSTGQTEGDSYPRQDEKIGVYAEANGHVVDICFMDDVSGTNDLEDRDGFAAMVAFMQEKGRTLLLVEGAHRFARDLIVQEMLIMRLMDVGITAIEVEGGNVLTDANPTKTFIRQILGAYAQLEKSMLVLKLKAARDRIRRETGRCDGSKPYGARPGDDPAVIERIKREKRWGCSFQRIADKLNRDGVPTQRGGMWRRSTVRNIWRREARKGAA